MFFFSEFEKVRRAVLLLSSVNCLLLLLQACHTHHQRRQQLLTVFKVFLWSLTFRTLNFSIFNLFSALHQQLETVLLLAFTVPTVLMFKQGKNHYAEKSESQLMNSYCSNPRHLSIDIPHIHTTSKITTGRCVSTSEVNIIMHLDCTAFWWGLLLHLVRAKAVWSSLPKEY